MAHLLDLSEVVGDILGKEDFEFPLKEGEPRKFQFQEGRPYTLKTISTETPLNGLVIKGYEVVSIPSEDITVIDRHSPKKVEKMTEAVKKYTGMVSSDAINKGASHIHLGTPWVIASEYTIPVMYFGRGG